MNLKNEKRKLGKKIRGLTGLPLPIAMRAAHFLVRGDNLKLHDLPAINPFIKEIASGCDCCGSVSVLAGPKGEYLIS